MTMVPQPHRHDCVFLLTDGQNSCTCRAPGHSWPRDGEHLFDEWKTRTGLPKPTQSRRCVHPSCTAFEVRDAPKS